MIKLVNLSFTHLNPDNTPVSETPLLSRVNLEIAEGEFILVSGPTGSGKSTFLKTLNGLAPNFTGGILEGEIWIDGQDFTGCPPHDFAHLVGYVNQQPEGFFVADTVLDELVYGAEQLGLSVKQIDENLKRIVEVLEIQNLLDRELSTLSSGQQQRVAIGSALIAGQKILLLDEPTSALDRAGANEVLMTLKRLTKEQGVTVLLAEHRISRVIAEVDSVLVVHGDGSVTKGPVEAQFNDARFTPPIIELGIKLGWNPFATNIAQAKEFWKQSPKPHKDIQVWEKSEPIIWTKDLEIAYEETIALEKTNLTFFGNQITAVMGPNGSGKTSLCWALQGLGTTSAGEVLLEEGTTSTLENEARLELVALVPQRANDLLFLNSLAEELEESDRYAKVGQGTTARLFQNMSGRIDTSVHPRDLSAGQQLALVLAIQMAKQPKVLILDEPTRGLDYHAKKALAQQLKALRDLSRSIILATHDIEFVALVADRVIALESGKVISDSSVIDALGPEKPYASQISQICQTEGLIRVDQVMA